MYDEGDEARALEDFDREMGTDRRRHRPNLIAVSARQQKSAVRRV